VLSRQGDGAFLVQIPAFLPALRAKRGYFLIPDWRIDVHIENRVAVALAAHYAVVQSEAEATTRGQEAWGETVVVEQVRKLPPRSEIDAYVVIARGASHDHIGDTAVDVEGLGFYHHDRAIASIDAVYAVFRIVVVDARSGRILAERDAGTAADPDMAYRLVDKALWPGEDKMPDAKQILPIRDALTVLIDESIDWTLKRMNLAP
jgi:hypothetical protein